MWPTKCTPSRWEEAIAGLGSRAASLSLLVSKGSGPPRVPTEVGMSRPHGLCAGPDGVSNCQGTKQTRPAPPHRPGRALGAVEGPAAQSPSQHQLPREQGPPRGLGFWAHSSWPPARTSLPISPRRARTSSPLDAERCPSLAQRKVKTFTDARPARCPRGACHAAGRHCPPRREN